jgi:hypothetical protein
MRPFYIPQGAGNNAVAVFLGGGTTPIQIPIYDVTAEPVFLGVMRSLGARTPGWQDTFEYDVPPGNRVLMLYARKFGGGAFVDFIEVPVAANQVEPIALSQYGMNDRPFFARAPLTPEMARFCATTPHMSPFEFKAVTKARGDENAPQGFCGALQYSMFRRVPASTEWQGPLTRDQVARLKEQYLPKWRAMGARVPPYDLTE